MVVSFVATSVAVAIAISMATTATVMTDSLQLGRVGVAYFYNLAEEMQILACQRVVEVDSYLDRRHFYHLGVDNLSVDSLHRDDISYIDTVGVKLAIYVVEHVLVKFHQACLVVLAIGVFASNAEIELVAFPQDRQGLLQT